MGIIKEGIVLNEDNTLSFGNNESVEKIKVNDFEVGEDTYKLRTHNEMTKLTKNHLLLFEATPGVNVHNFSCTHALTTFTVEGPESVRITLDLQRHAKYKVLLDGNVVDEDKSNVISGRLSFSLALTNGVGNVVVDRIEEPEEDAKEEATEEAK